MNNFTIEDIKKSKVASLNGHLVEVEKKKRKSKFNNDPKVVDGIRFDSAKEVARYGELKLLLKAGKIGLLERQVPYELNEGGAFSYKYVADFVYRLSDTGLQVVEDCKGYRTREYKKKKRLIKKVWGIEIFES